MSIPAETAIGAQTDRGAWAAGDRQVANWLFLVCIGIAALVIFGGWVRLTHSGLSMVEWRPITGLLPPLGDQAWEQAFGVYRDTPEYRIVNAGMSLSEFKSIYWMEYLHRVLGRAVGLVYAVPFFFFLARRVIPLARLPAFGLIGLLFAAQGVLGWWMVKSGLVNEPAVSQYRLAAHLLLALGLLGACLWLGLNYRLGRPLASSPAAALRVPAALFLAAVVVQIASGALMAGLKAGWVSASFPKMRDQWIPAGLWSQEPWLRNIFENQLTVHFQHRWLAFLVLGAVVWLPLRARRVELDGYLRWAALRAPYLVAGQILVGVIVIFQGVPAWMASIHQVVGMITLALAVSIYHQTRAVSP